ncbi:hypothetical protein ACFL2T_01770 [Elusimicrobiota bacterium]
MNPKSTSSLVWLSMILLLIGAMAMNPGLRFILFVLAAISAAIPAILARSRWRIAGFVTLVVAVVLAGISYPAFDRHMKQYRERAKRQVASDAVGTQQQLPDAK